MKNLIFLLFVILTACGPEAEKWQRQYIIKNDSSVSVELQFYRGGNLAFRFGNTQLQMGEQLEGLELDRSGGPWSNLTPEQLSNLPVNSLEADSVRVVFNDQKLSVYTWSSSPDGDVFMPSERNLLRDGDYSSIGGDKLLFSINESDFENATDCNGNCN